MNKLKTLDGARNIVSFNDLYKSGLIKNEEIIDPATNERLTGCMALTWRDSINGFDIVYTDDCLKKANLSGSVTSNNNAISSTVQLMHGNNVVYTTTSDNDGNYSFSDIDTGDYILVVSQQYKTKYGKEINLYKSTVENINATLYSGDFNNDGIINHIDVANIKKCWPVLSGEGCIPREYYDLNSSGYADSDDVTVLRFNQKISDISLNGTFNLKGKIISDKSIDTVKLENNTNEYSANIDNDGNFEFTNIPKGAYRITATLYGYGTFDEYYLIYKDTNEINITMYYGDIYGSDGVIDEQDLNYIQDAINDIASGDATYAHHKKADLNNDGRIDEKDLNTMINTIKKYENRRLELK